MVRDQKVDGSSFLRATSSTGMFSPCFFIQKKDYLCEGETSPHIELRLSTFSK